MKAKRPFLHKKPISGGSVTDNTVEVRASDVLASMARELTDWSLTVPQQIIDAKIDAAVDWCVRDVWANIWVEFIDGDIQVSHLCDWFEDDPLRTLHFSLGDLVREAADRAEDEGQAEAFLTAAESDLTKCLRLVQERRKRLKK